jgi:hypothetical protein
MLFFWLYVFRSGLAEGERARSSVEEGLIRDRRGGQGKRGGGAGHQEGEKERA